MDHHRKKGKKTQVGPLNDQEEPHPDGNTSFELEMASKASEKQNNRYVD